MLVEFCGHFFTTHVKPSKLLEKSKNLEKNPRKFWPCYPRMMTQTQKIDEKPQINLIKPSKIFKNHKQNQKTRKKTRRKPLKHKKNFEQSE
jgi:hypothetical protein